jgi:predicted phage terminase large subunit-like protein
MTSFAPSRKARAAALLELRRRGAIASVPKSYGAWLTENRTEFQWTAPHFRVMQDTLDRVTAGEIKRVIFQVPIRHGKTEHNTYGYTAYHFARNPRFRALLGSYNQTQAQKFSRDIRKLIRTLGVGLSSERDAAGEWETAAGGGLRAVGAGAGVASVNADGIIIDDPIGSRDDAESLAHRSRVFDWITNDILARAEPNTWVVLTMSRWHQDDPVGRLLDQQGDRWYVVDLPALAEPDDPLGRAEGEALWPDLRSAEWLAEKQIELGSYGFASLLQGRPRPREGGMFKWDWWRTLEDAPVCERYVRYWDLAGTQPEKGKSDPDYSAGTLAGRMPDQRTVIVHQAAFQKSVAERDAMLERIAREDVAKYGNRVSWWIETEAGIAGKDRTNTIIRRLHAVGLKVNDEAATGSKEIRADPLASATEAGNVCLGPDDPSAPWRDAFRMEAADFPNGKHDDRVDSAAGAFNKLALGHGPAHSARFKLT